MRLTYQRGGILANFLILFRKLNFFSFFDKLDPPQDKWDSFPKLSKITIQSILFVLLLQIHFPIPLEYPQDGSVLGTSVGGEEGEQRGQSKKQQNYPLDFEKHFHTPPR